MPFRHTTSRTIDAPAETLWRILTDTTLWPRWGTSIEEVRCTERIIGAGSMGTVKIAHLPLHLPFEVTVFDEDRLFWKWEVAGVEATSHQVKRPAGNPPQVIFGVPNLLYAPYLGICKLALTNIEAMAKELRAAS